MRVHGKVRKVGNLANLGENLKILKHLQVLPLPSGNIREAKRGRKRRGVRKSRSIKLQFKVCNPDELRVSPLKTGEGGGFYL